MKRDKGQSNSHMSMTQAGQVLLDSTDSITVTAPNISILGNKVLMEGKNATNITGKTGDCKIERVSLVRHTH